MAVRVLTIILAYLVAVAAASLTVATIIILAQTLYPSPPAHAPALDEAVSFIVRVTVGVYVGLAFWALLPSIIVLTIAEIYRFRSVIFYVLSALVIVITSSAEFLLVALLVGHRNLPILDSYRLDWINLSWFAAVYTASAVGSLIYWAIAGRTAGAWRQARR
jgi:hypothetical protein